MADRGPQTATMRAEWEEWRKDRPPAILAVADKYPPWKLFRYTGPDGKDLGRVYVIAYDEPVDPADPVTVTVAVTGEYNRIAFSRSVFGVDPARLTECDLPGPDEDVGDTAAEMGLTREQIEALARAAFTRKRD